MRGYISVFIYFLIYYSTISLQAQVIVHHNRNIEDGLVYSQVISIHEDRLGYLWLGTTSGLSKWDGVEFKNFGVESGLRSTDVQTICEDSSGILHVGTRHGIFRLVGERFEPLPNIPEQLKSHIEALYFSTDNTLFIATALSGVWKFDGSQYQQIFDEKGKALVGTVCIAQAQNGGLYFGTASQGVQIYKNGKVSKLLLPKNKLIKNIRCIFEDKFGRLFIGTTEGLSIIHDNSIVSYNENNGLPGNFINHIAQMPDSNIYVATSDGIAVFKHERIQSTITMENGLSSNFIWFVYANRNGMIYLGTDGTGFDYYQPGVWTTISTTSGLPDNTVWSILQANDGSFYFSTDKGIAHYESEITEIWNMRSGLSNDQVLSSFQDSRGSLYFGNNYHGLDVFSKNKFRRIGKKNGLTGEGVWTINEDISGKVYFGTYGGGISIMERSKISDTLNTLNGLVSDYIVSSYRTDNGAILFGTEGAGAVKIKDGEIQNVYIPGTTVWSSFMDSAGNLFFGTNENGLIYKIDDKWDTLTTSDGLTNNSVLGILQDDNDIIYLTTDNGLNIIDFSGELPIIRHAGRKDGLAGNEFNQGAYMKDKDGRLWFGTTNGVSYYRPWLDNENKNPPKTYIKRIRLFGSDISQERMNKERSFAYNENFFQFDFIGIDLSASEKVKYMHRLSGIDYDWVESSSRHIQYTNLSPGEYEFEVKTANEWGYWSQPEKLGFIIAPPFWKTWWFIFAVASVAGSIIWFLIAMRVKRLLAVERLRAKIAADLHDDIGAGLSEISILSAVINAKSPQKFKGFASSELNKIGLVSRTLIESMSDIVWLVNPKNDSLYDLFTHLKDSFIDILELKNIEFSSTNLKQLENINLSMESRQHIYLIFKEVINNAIKYSECSRLELVVESRKRNVVIILSDNGKGFDAETTNAGNGLKNIKQRAEKVGGKIKIESAPNEGTKIIFEGRV